MNHQELMAKRFALKGRLRLATEPGGDFEYLEVHCTDLDYEEVDQALAALRDHGPFWQWTEGLLLTSGSTASEVDVSEDGMAIVRRSGGWLGRVFGGAQ